MIEHLGCLHCKFQVFGLSISAKKSFVILVALIILPTIWLDNLSLLSYVSGVFVNIMDCSV
ncbi:transmembrane amino acid transporter family protein, putative [Medicago truncatula]|uniref:Transmembrane amino acid transporter family protein, putative n=1 Tax=Medicago truncatula TaxID=3880 RepID=G7L106_MEDTR|nr:transmembrane amino acid transporter family protein, putative [Medicago truncatula]